MEENETDGSVQTDDISEEGEDDNLRIEDAGDIEEDNQVDVPPNLETEGNANPATIQGNNT